MSKKQSSLAIGLVTLVTGVGLGWLIVPFAILNAIFVHEFLTMKGH